MTEAAESYHDLEKVSAWLAETGLADLALYEGRFTDAVTILEKGAAADRAARRLDAAADKFSLLAYAQIQRQQQASGVAAARSALEVDPKGVKTRFQAAQIFVAGNEIEKAQELAKELGSEVQIEPQAFGKLIEGEAALKNGDGRQAVKLFIEANSLLDSWIGRFDLGRAYLEIGAFAQADSEFDRCLKRRGEALAIFLDECQRTDIFRQFIIIKDGFGRA